MALFRRKGHADHEGAPVAPATPREDARAPLDAFWSWWAEEGRAAADAHLEAGPRPGAGAEVPFPTVLGERLAPFGLTGEVLPEATGPVLLLAAGADPERRATARRLVLEAPAGHDDHGWTVLDHRPAVSAPEEVVLVSDGELVDFDRVRVAARMQGSRMDVTVHHPAYPSLPEESRERLTVLALDAALGELGTELWVGGITAATSAPIDGFGLSSLRAVAADLERQHLDADGTPRWVELQGQGPTGPLVALVRRVLVRATAPHLDTYVSVALPYRGRDSRGLPDDASTAQLETLAQRVQAALGDSGALVAHLSTGGSRTLHLFVDSTTDAVDVVGAVAGSWEGGRADVHAMLDPGWDAVAHLRQ